MASRTGVILIVCAALLVGLGITMLASTNYYLDPAKGGGETYRNVWGQVKWLGLGVAVLVATALTNYQRLLALRWWLFGLTLLAMIACLFEATGKEVGGARRWLALPGGLGGQPSEFAKIAVIIALAGWFHLRENAVRTFRIGALFPLLILSALLAAFWLQRDLGNAMLIGVVALAIMWDHEVTWLTVALFWALAAITVRLIEAGDNRPKEEAP
jgi:cell division protein FtsW